MQTYGQSKDKREIQAFIVEYPVELWQDETCMYRWRVSVSSARDKPW